MYGSVDRIEKDSVFIIMDDKSSIIVNKKDYPLLKEGLVIKLENKNIIVDFNETNSRKIRIQDKLNKLFKESDNN